jgi:hypothetical protein
MSQSLFVHTNKISLDKYYTPIEKSQELIEFTLNFIGRNKIDTIIEPSAGNGSFSNYLFNTYSNIYKIHAFDIKPEEGRIKEQDFLKITNFRYNDKCLIIGNPPFGENKNLLTQFFNKSILLSEYIAFILPISYLNNSKSFFYYDLISSKDLGLMNYSDRELTCCFNIYKRPISGSLNKLKSNKIDFIEIKQEKYNHLSSYDFRVQRLGENIGKVVKEKEIKSYYAIKIHSDDNELKERIRLIFDSYDWMSVKQFISIPYLTITDIYDVLNEELKLDTKDNKTDKLFEF